MANPVTETIKALAAHLRGLSGLTVREGWPAANVPLVFPTLTITQGKPEFTNLQPYELSKTDPDEETNQTTVKRVVGQYEIRVQLDLWARNTYERDVWLESIFAKLNPDVSPMGLRLKLTSYHDLWASYILVAQENVEDEAATQRQECRVKFSLLASCKAVLSKTEYAMIEFDTQFSTPDTISSEE